MFFAVLPFALFGIVVITFPVPVHWDAAAAWVLALDGVLVLCLIGLWPYHRLWLVRRLLAGMAAVSFGRTALGESEPLALDDLIAARKKARESWACFVERWPLARTALVQVRLHLPEYEDQAGTPVLFARGAHVTVVELREREDTPEDDAWEPVAFAVWGEVLDASPHRVRVRLDATVPESFDVPATCEVDRRQVCDWELEMPDGSLEGGYGLRVRAALAWKNGTWLPRMVRRRLRRCRSLPEPTS